MKVVLLLSPGVFDLMVPRKPISEGVNFLATYIIQYLISEQSQERIMHTSVIQIPEVYTYPYFILLLLFLYHHLAHPIRYSYGINDAYREHLIEL